MENSEDASPRKKFFLAARTLKELVLKSNVFVDKSLFIKK